jgi:hypothetical protein
MVLVEYRLLACYITPAVELVSFDIIISSILRQIMAYASSVRNNLDFLLLKF